MFPVLFCMARTAGWLSHWKEQLKGETVPIFRPTQVYEGPEVRQYVPIHKRGTGIIPTEQWKEGSDGFSPYQTAVEAEERPTQATSVKHKRKDLPYSTY
jgi:Citrate synthase, C-terminal domain